MILLRSSKDTRNPFNCLLVSLLHTLKATINQQQFNILQLIMEVALSDGSVSNAEKNYIQLYLSKVLPADFVIDDSMLNELLLAVSKSNDLYLVTSELRKNMNDDDKLRLLEELWSIAYSDNKLDAIETHIIKNIANLLYVPHAIYIKAKQNSKNITL